MPVRAVHTVPADLLCGHDAEEIAEHEGHLQIVCRHCLAELRIEKACPGCGDPAVISRVVQQGD